jgi:hypothetical protein
MHGGMYSCLEKEQGSTGFIARQETRQIIAFTNVGAESAAEHGGPSGAAWTDTV